MEPDKLHREYQFQNFSEAIIFVNQVAKLAEKANHHPDITINYNKVGLTFWTHNVNKVTEKDLELAKVIDTLAK